MLSPCDGDEASPSVLSVEPALCRSALHPPLSRQVAALQCSRDGLRLPTSMQVYANLVADSAPVRLRLRCSVLHVLVRHSRRYRLPIPGQSFMEGKVGPSPLSAGPTQCRSVLHSFSKVGGRFAVLDVQIPPCLVQLLVMLEQTLDCHARIHVSYMCYILFLLRLAHPLVAPHWSWGRFICTQCGARALLFSTALPIHQAADCSARYPDLAFSAQTQVAVAHPWGRSCHSSVAPSPGKSATSTRLTFTSALIRVTSHLQHWAHTGHLTPTAPLRHPYSLPLPLTQPHSG